MRGLIPIRSGEGWLVSSCRPRAFPSETARSMLTPLWFCWLLLGRLAAGGSVGNPPLLAASAPAHSAHTCHPLTLARLGALLGLSVEPGRQHHRWRGRVSLGDVGGCRMWGRPPTRAPAWRLIPS